MKINKLNILTLFDKSHYYAIDIQKSYENHFDFVRGN